MRLLTGVFALLALCQVGVERAASAESMQLSVDGQQRKYLLERLAGRGPSPTIIVLHGAFGTPEATVQQTGLGKLGPQQGFAVVFPQARTIVWNRFPPGKESKQAIEFFGQRGGLPNDVGFIRALAMELVHRGVSDPARIYIAGGSNGGFMTLAMICHEAGLFAGAGVAVASMIEQAGEDCRPAKPMPIVFLHGTADAIVPYRGGAVAPLGGRGASDFSVWPAERTVSFFRQLNGCAGEPARSTLPVQGPHRVEIERSTNCAGGAVMAYRAAGGTHDLRVSFNVGRALLDFFRENGPGIPRPGASAAPRR